jgi:hypothetical protein
VLNIETMNVEAFDRLKIEHKILLIEDMGELVFSMEYYEHRVFLFSFNSLFVEVHKNLETNAIDKMDSIKLGDLDKYLSQITLGNLVREAYIL